MFVRNWMTHDPATVEPDASVSFVAMEMSRQKITHFLVTGSRPEEKQPMGIVSKYDIIRSFPRDINPFSIEFPRS